MESNKDFFRGSNEYRGETGCRLSTEPRSELMVGSMEIGCDKHELLSKSKIFSYKNYGCDVFFVFFGAMFELQVAFFGEVFLKMSCF